MRLDRFPSPHGQACNDSIGRPVRRGSALIRQESSENQQAVNSKECKRGDQLEQREKSGHPNIHTGTCISETYIIITV